MRRTFPIALLAATVAACASQTPEQRAIADVADALGGADRILAVHTLVLEGEGTLWNTGQDMTIDATGQTFSVTGYRRAMDLEASRMRVTQTRTPNFPYFQGQSPQTQTFGVDGEVAYAMNASGAATRAPAETAADRQAELYHHPIVLVRAALGPQASVGNVRNDGGEQLVDITLPDAGPFTLALDAATHRPTRIRSASDHPNLGDVVIETRFDGYTEVDGLQLPEQLTTSTDRFKTAELSLSRPTLNGEIGDIAAPETARAAATPGPSPVNVAAEALAPGVWLLAGQSHHSVLVEFDDHLMLIEAPQSEARTLGVMARARELVPGKPLTQLVSTHHHFDHSAGLRAAVAEGLTIVTQQANVAYYREAVTRPHTRRPDALARSPKPIAVEGVEDARVIEDKTRRVELYRIAGSPHADTLLMAYLPRERLLVEADAFNPGSSVYPFAANLLEQVRARKLRVDRIAPLHGAVAPLAELVNAVPAS
ncbi:MAG TPA: MBL fold metallo-hydrolase [Vicinamibacterales bacterium]|nr:MBL fold metallo-hydrolase [Vicinamibacterales bacterium]